MLALLSWLDGDLQWKSSLEAASGRAAGQGRYMTFCDISLCFSTQCRGGHWGREAEDSPGQPREETSDKLLLTRSPLSQGYIDILTPARMHWWKEHPSLLQQARRDSDCNQKRTRRKERCSSKPLLHSLKCLSNRLHS